MTTPAGIGHRDAAAVAEAALTAVFPVELVRSVREDSPLSALGMVPADLVCLGDAIADAAALRGWSCALDDADLADARTVAELVEAITVRCVAETS